MHPAFDEVTARPERTFGRPAQRVQPPRDAVGTLVLVVIDGSPDRLERGGERRIVLETLNLVDGQQPITPAHREMPRTQAAERLV